VLTTRADVMHCRSSLAAAASAEMARFFLAANRIAIAAPLLAYALRWLKNEICRWQKTQRTTPIKFQEFAMFSPYRTAGLVLMIGLSLVALGTTVSAASPKLLIAPGDYPGLPKFGFSSSTIYGYGERVIFVRPGGRAARLGLEPGDVILSLNGFRLAYHGSWNDALSRAMSNGGWVQLLVRDVRSGQLRLRQTFVGYSDSPVAHYYTTNVNVAPHLHTVPHISAHLAN
jgi:hypothetical protein